MSKRKQNKRKSVHANGQEELANRRQFSGMAWTITKTICASEPA